MRDRFISLGADPVCNTPEEFARHVAEEIDEWAGVVKRAKIPMQG